jgi:hypothetical protein
MPTNKTIAPTASIDTGAHPPRDYPIYTMRHEPPSSLIGGWHIYRQDPGESCYHILGQGLDQDEARVCVQALNELAKAKVRRARLTALPASGPTPRGQHA